MLKESFISKSFIGERDLPPLSNAAVKPSAAVAVAIPNQLSTDLEALDEKVKSMMEKGQRMIPDGKQANGTQKQQTVCICKVCGKKGLVKQIRDHIEANHLRGISLPCDQCGKSFSSRTSLEFHKRKYHK